MPVVTVESDLDSNDLDMLCDLCAGGQRSQGPICLLSDQPPNPLVYISHVHTFESITLDKANNMSSNNSPMWRRAWDDFLKICSKEKLTEETLVFEKEIPVRNKQASIFLFLFLFLFVFLHEMPDVPLPHWKLTEPKVYFGYAMATVTSDSHRESVFPLWQESRPKLNWRDKLSDLLTKSQLLSSLLSPIYDTDRLRTGIM